MLGPSYCVSWAACDGRVSPGREPRGGDIHPYGIISEDETEEKVVLVRSSFLQLYLSHLTVVLVALCTLRATVS